MVWVTAKRHLPVPSVVSIHGYTYTRFFNRNWVCKKQNKKMPRMKNNHKTVPQNMDTGCTQLLFSDCKIPSILAWNVSAVVSKAADKKNRLRKL